MIIDVSREPPRSGFIQQGRTRSTGRADGATVRDLTCERVKSPDATRRIGGSHAPCLDRADSGSCHDGLVLGSEPLTFLRAVEMPGVKGRIDHLAVDLSLGPDSSRLSADTVVIDGRAVRGFAD